MNNHANFAANVANTLATKVDLLNAQTIDGIPTFLKAIKVAFLEKDIVRTIPTVINWISNNWYTIPGRAIPFSFGEVRTYELMANYQYNDGTATYNHYQMGGSCRLPGGIGWKAGGSRAEVIMNLQCCHNANDNVMTLRSAIGGPSRGLEVKPNFDISLAGLGFIEFALKRL